MHLDVELLVHMHYSKIKGGYGVHCSVIAKKILHALSKID
jgi:hypothetical protein